MLLEFRFVNFKSFRDEAVLSFVANSDETAPDNFVVCSDDSSVNLLKAAAIYGANASGKSTVFQAFEFAQDFIVRSANNNPDAPIKVTPFLLDESKSKPSMFEFTFIQNEVRYQYGFSVTNRLVEKEWLISYPKGRSRKLFERSLQDNTSFYTFGAHLKGEKEKISELTRANALFLSVGATFNHSQLLDIYHWFSDKTIFVRSSEIPEPLVFDFVLEHPDLVDQLKGLINYADLGIVDFSLAELEFEPHYPPNEILETIPAVHGAPDDVLKKNGDSGLKVHQKSYEFSISHQSGQKIFSFPWEAESDGTRRLFGLSAPIFDTLKNGKVLFVDEIDRSLHPLLTRKLIQLFQNPQLNSKGAQLVFNTHDTSLLSAGLFRRDQIWFLEKDQSGASHIYPLLEYSPRKGESLEKGYLQGRYGAIPFLGEYPFGGK
ncbi:MAG: ATP-binding protein [Chloroflexi bacterium]|nr:ATP-binding protein [Chloroflexota bacterium]